MADVNASINIDINASAALAQLKALETQISNFNNSIARSNVAASAAQRSMNDALRAQIDATGRFNTSIRTMEGGVSSLGTAFDKGTLSARQYFRYAASQMPGLTNAFRGLGKEQAEMAALAENRVKQLQTRYVSLGKDINGMQKMLAIQPKALATGYATDIALAEQKQQLFNRALQLGSTGMVNWGKNTQWAGRQLMVGFTVPMTIAAGAAAKFFMDLDKSGTAFKRVYGDLNTTTQEAEKNLKAVEALGLEYTKYGLAVNEVIDIGARAAATGAQNEDLLAATEQTIRLATLGQTDYQTALDATISLQTAFGISSANLATTIDFLNAVENQTVLTLEDVARAVPRVAPVIKGLGGDVQDLAVFMTALREGGVSAEQGANALKSGLASLINPTDRATETLKEMGINIKAIVDANRGDLMGTVRAFGQALESVSEFERQQALEATFGKYQYARLGALFKNIARDGSQAARAMELAGMSVQDLASLSEQELSILSESVTNKFLGAVERLKVAIAPIGEMFLKVATPIIEVVTTIANKFNELPDTVKTVIAGIVGVVGLIAPAVLMGIGLIANGIGNGLKFILALRGGIKGLVAALTGSASSFQYQSTAALDAAAAMGTLDGKSDALTASLLMQDGAVRALAAAYGGLAGAARSAAASMPAAFPGVPVVGRGGRGVPVVRRATGGIIPGTGNTDSVPALLTPGEFVMTKEATQQFGPILASMNAGTTQGFQNGGGVTQAGRSRASRLEFAHIADKFEMTADDISRMMRSLEEIGATSSKAYRELERASKAQEKVYGYTNLGVPLRGDVNALLGGAGAQRGQVSSAIRQSGAGAASGIIDVFSQRGLILDDDQSRRFADEFYKSFAQEIDKLPDEVLKDRNLTTPFRTAVKNAGLKIGQDFSNSAMKIVDEEMKNITTIVTETGQKHGGTGRASVPTKRGAGRVTSYLSRGRIRSSIFSKLMGGRTMQQVAAESVPVGAAVNQGAERGMGNASPSRLARGAVGDYVAGAEVGAKENIGRATRAGQTLGSAVNRGFTGELSPSQARGAVILGSGGADVPQTTQAGAPIAATTPAVDDDQARVAAALARQEQEIDGATKQTKTMKDRIRGVSGKLFGVSAALTGLSIAGSFMGGQIGEVANSIMPFAFALDGLTALIPMMMSPAGAVIAALAATGAALWFLNNEMNQVRERGQDFADALTTSAAEVYKVGEYFGNQSLVERQKMIDTAARAGVKPKDVAAGLEFIGSDIGQEMAKEFTLSLERQGSTASAEQFANKLSSMMMQGVIDFSQAKQIAAGLAEQLGQAELSASIIGKLERIVGPNGEDITKRPLQIAAEITANERQITESIAMPTAQAIERAMNVDLTQAISTGAVSLGAGIPGLISGVGSQLAQLGIDIPFVTDMGKNLLSFLDKDFEKATESAQTYGKAVGNSLRNAYDNLNSAIIRNDEVIQNAKKKDRPELRKKALEDEAKARNEIFKMQQSAQENFGKLVQANATLSKETLDGMQVSLKEMYQDPGMQLMLDSLFARTGGLDQNLRFDILMNLQSGQLNPMAANSLFDLIGNDEQAATTLSMMVDAKGVTDANEFLMKLVQVGDQEVKKKLLLQYAAEGDPQVAATLAGFTPEKEGELQTAVDRAREEYQLALDEYNTIGYDSQGRQTRGGRFRLLSEEDAAVELERLRQYYSTANGDLEKFYADREAIATSGKKLLPGLENVPSNLYGPQDEVFSASAQTVADYELALQELAAIDIRPKIKLDGAKTSEEDLKAVTDAFEQYLQLPEKSQKLIDIDTLQATKGFEDFEVNWKKIDSLKDLVTTLNLSDNFSATFKAFGFDYASFSSLPDIVKRAIMQYITVYDVFRGTQGRAIASANAAAGSNAPYAGYDYAQSNSLAAQNALAAQEAQSAAQDLYEQNLPTGTGGSNVPSTTDNGGGGGGGGGGGETAKSGADLIKEMIDGLKEQLKFLGDYKKVGDEVKSGLAQALRNAGAPEQLIADIISKGAEGIKMAKELLKDKAKKLKEVTDLMLEVTRLTFVESQRAEAANLATQSSAQMALANAGLNPSVVANMDSQQAQAVAAAYRAYQTAQRAADAAENKSKKKRQEANKELAKTRKEWEMVTNAVNKNTAAQDKNAIAQALLTAQQERQAAQNKVSAALALAGRGMSSEQIGGMLEIEGAANQVVAYTNKIKELNDEKAKLEKKGRKNWSEEEKKRYQQLQRQLKRVNGDYSELLKLLTRITKEQAKGIIAVSTAGFAGQAISARREQEAQNILMGQGYTYDQASGIAGNEDDAKAITEANKAVEDGESKVNRLLKERSKYPKGSKEYKELSEKIKKAREQLKEAKTAQDNLNQSIADAVKEQQKLEWQSVVGGITTEIAKQQNSQKFLNMGIKDQLVLGKLNGLTLEQQNYFLGLSVDEQNAFISALQQSIPLVEKIAQAFSEIEDRQKVITIQNKDLTNQQIGNRDALQEQSQLLDDSAKAKQKEIDAVQDQIDVIQELNDDLQHQVDLIQHENDILQHQSDLISRENELYQRQIDHIQRASDEIQDQIDLIQHENELIQHQIDVAQRQADLISRENDLYSRGLELISRQEEDINTYYDERLNTLSKVEKANDRIVQKQKDQIDIAKAISEGDIYAAAQAAQQMRANDAAFSAEQTRNNLEEARQGALKNLVADVNGELLTREQIEKRIQDNNDRIYEINKSLIDLQDIIYNNDQKTYDLGLLIYENDQKIKGISDLIYENDQKIQAIGDLIYANDLKIYDINQKIYSNNQQIYAIQEDMLEPLNKQLEAINKQKEAIADNITEWERYFKWLEDNAVDPLTGIKFKDLAEIKERFDAFYQDYLNQGLSTSDAIAKAFQDATSAFNLTDAQKAGLQTRLGISFDQQAGGDQGGTTPPTTDQEMSTTREEATKTIPEVQKVRDTVKEIKDEFIKVGNKIVDAKNDLINSAQPAIASTKAAAEGLVDSFKATRDFVKDKLIDVTFVEMRDFIKEKMPKAVDTLIEAMGSFKDLVDEEVISFIDKMITKMGDFGKAITDSNGVNKDIASMKTELKEVKDFIEDKLIAVALENTKGKFNEIKTFIANNVQPEIVNMRNGISELNTYIATTLLVTLNSMVTHASNFNTAISSIQSMQISYLISVFDALSSSVFAASNQVWSLISNLNSVPSAIYSTIYVNTVYTTSGTPTQQFTGGYISQKFAAGGIVPGNGVPRDSIPILASPGEFIVRNSMVDKYGLPLLTSINQGSYEPSSNNRSGSIPPISIKKSSSAFRVPRTGSVAKPSVPKFSTPKQATTISTPTQNSKNSNAAPNTTVYNDYKVSVTASTNASADEIANKVMTKIRDMDSRSIRSARG